ncbi:hypothetical protein HYT17_03115 [Candidatus Microgenomates bacterium]|nr:hypothetical protein [Candidatus Microgenomates bacterium]
METVFVAILLVAVAVLIILPALFPGINIFTILNPKKKYFYNAVISSNNLQLKGFRREVFISIHEIKRMSMGLFFLRAALLASGVFAIQINTTTDTFFVFQSPFNLFAPALKRDLIKELKTLNPNIELDYNLKKYTEGFLADVYINKEQIKRGLLVILIFVILGILAYLAQLFK